MIPGDDTVGVLIIDSDNVRRGMLACTLPASRYSLEFANSAERGLDLLVETQPDVVIVGSDSTASDLCQRVTSLPAGANATIVLMDERFTDEVLGRAEMEAVGADLFLPFPFEGEDFDGKVGSKLREKRGTRRGLAGGERPTRDSAAPHTARPPSAESRPTDGELAWKGFRERVEELHARLHTMDYYSLLGVASDASSAAIKDAYFARSMEYHPDRFLRLDDEELRTQIYDVFKRMSEAFKVLSSPEARSRYDGNLSGPERDANLRLAGRAPSETTPRDPAADAQTPAGRKYLHHALRAEAEGKLRSARMYLSMTLQYEPDNEAIQARLEALTRRLR